MRVMRSPVSASRISIAGGTWASASTASLRPSLSSARKMLGPSWIPAPISRNSGACSSTRTADLHGDITAWRRDIHAHPELLFDVHRTAASVAEKLKSFGCDEVVTGIGKTGVVGVIRGGKGAGSRVIGLRADMDALPITEA